MSLYSASPAMPDTLEAVEAVSALVSASASIVDGLLYLTSTDHVFTHEITGAHPDRYVIVREMLSLGGRREAISGMDDVPIQIVAAVDAKRPNPRTWLNAIHRRLRVLLAGKVPSLTSSVVHLPLRQERAPSAYYDATVDEYLADAQWGLTLTTL